MQENHSSQQAVKALAEKLMEVGCDFELLNRESDACISIRFVGPFNNRQVIWNATIRTLQDKFSEATAAPTTGFAKKCFKQSINISENNEYYAIEIALNLRQIDEAAIKRTIIMIRKYKRLHIGCHEYGEAVTFKTDL
jgi:hypothetical protein